MSDNQSAAGTQAADPGAPPPPPGPPQPPPPAQPSGGPAVPPPPPPPALSAGTPAPDSNQQDGARRELIFKSDLAEVYLLLDFITGRPERNLDTISMKNPANQNEEWKSGQIVQKLMEIQYPPQGPQEEIAKQAAILLMAKDQLSRVAAPARGATIAYTAMYVDREGRSWWGRVFRDRTPRSITPGEGEAPSDTPGDTTDGRPWWKRMFGWGRSGETSALDHHEAASAAPTDERRSLIQLAKEAFPHFERHVRRFRFLRRLLLYGGLLVLLVTAQTSWDVGHGRDVLGRIAQAQKDWDALLQTNPALADPGLCQAYQRGQTNPATDQHAQNQPPPDQHAQNQPPPDQHGQPQPAAGQHVQNQPGGTQGSAAATTTVDPNWLACARLGDIQTSREQAYSDLDQIFRCRGASCNAYLHVLHWAFLLCSGSEPQTISSGEPAPTTEPPVPSTPGAANTASSTGTGSESSPASANAPTPGKAAQQQQPATHIYWQSAISVLNVFTSYVLPLLYGLLGTIIGAFRSIQSKIRSSELAPRDFGLTIVGAFLGMAGGLVIGILFSPTSAPAPGNGNPLGNITLTAAALAFLAGYASQSFFGFIDDVIKKIFPADVAMSSPPPVAGSR